MKQTHDKRRVAWIALAATAWIVAVGTGFGALRVYAHTPGVRGQVPLEWPALEAVLRQEGRPTLILLAHPRCSCTRATLRELERLVARAGGDLVGTVLFYRPVEAAPGWERTDLWHLAESIPGFHAEVDPGGAAARAFGAHTSGHAVLYDAAGELVFSGGLTASRAHEGDNRGCDAIREFLLSGRVVERETPVYGCRIQPVSCPRCDG